MDWKEILSDINYLSYASSLLKWIFIFGIVGIVLVIAGHKFKLFKRNKKWPNILAKLYYVLIPLFFIISAFKFAPIRNTQNELNSVMHKHEQGCKDLVYSFLGSVINDSLIAKNSSAKSIVDYYINETIEEQSDQVTGKLGFGKKFIAKWDKKIRSSFLESILEKKIIEKTTGAIGLSEDLGEALYSHSFDKLFKKGEIVEIAIDEINNVFSKIYKSLFILMGLVLLIPIAEIIASRYFKY